jgi:hypothetical protein
MKRGTLWFARVGACVASGLIGLRPLAQRWGFDLYFFLEEQMPIFRKTVRLADGRTAGERAFAYEITVRLGIQLWVLATRANMGTRFIFLEERVSMFWGDVSSGRYSFIQLLRCNVRIFLF